MTSPRDLSARLARAQGLTGLGDLAGARDLLERLVAEAPACQEAWWQLRTVVARQGDWGRLRPVLERLIEGMPAGDRRDYDEAHIRLLFGDLPRGWACHEARLRLPGLHTEWSWDRPVWDGRPFPGRTLLIHWEQGFGDTLMFIRYAALAKARGGRVVALVQREVADLVATCPGVDQVVPHLDPVPPHDFTVPLLSLPRVFGTDLAGIPAPVPYLDVPAHVPNRLAIRQQLVASRGRVRVGVLWAGSPAHPRDADRSLPAPALARLGVLPGVAWHSFQIGRGPAPALPGLTDLAPRFSSFSDTAYALSGMDLVITVDTALVHLAGALGIPTLLLLPFFPDYRWLLDRTDSPWYPSLRLYRQPRPGAWEPVLEQVLADLLNP